MVKIDVPLNQYLHVYVWNNLAAMYENTNFETNDYGACYAASVYTKNKFGEIHLIKEGFGAGLFAHELQHFVLHWMFEYGFPRDNQNREDICLMAGRITAKFWNWFHEVEGEWTL